MCHNKHFCCCFLLELLQDLLSRACGCKIIANTFVKQPRSSINSIISLPSLGVLPMHKNSKVSLEVIKAAEFSCSCENLATRRASWHLTRKPTNWSSVLRGASILHENFQNLLGGGARCGTFLDAVMEELPDGRGRLMVLDGAHVAVGRLLQGAHLPHDHPKAEDVRCSCHLHMS